jgi:hypothetical protein
VTPNLLGDSSGSGTNDGPVHDTQSADMRTYGGESMDLPRMGAVELVTQEGLYVVFVVAAAALQAGTSERTVCLQRKPV